MNGNTPGPCGSGGSVVSMGTTSGDPVSSILRFRYHREVPIKEAIASSRATADLEQLTPAVCLFRSLADPTRLVVLQHLALGEHRVVELTEHVGLAQSTVSGHLACLRDCGLVSFRPQGRSSVYSLACPEVLELLAAAEQVLTATGSAVVLCPTYGAGPQP